MPKIIENIRETLLAETRRQIIENGYSATTIRSVASACGLGTGTVYNYFKSKDMLIATFMLEDWQQSLSRMQNAIPSGSDNGYIEGSSPSAEAVLGKIYDELHLFLETHSALFQDQEAAKAFASAFSEKHKILRDQLAELIRPICDQTTASDKEFLAEFMAEALLTWTVAGRSFEDIFSVLNRLTD